jgi:hypothetical protein
MVQQLVLVLVEDPDPALEAQLIAAGLVCARHPGTDIAPGQPCAMCRIHATEPEWVRRARANALPARASYTP